MCGVSLNDKHCTTAVHRNIAMRFTNQSFDGFLLFDSDFWRETCLSACIKHKIRLGNKIFSGKITKIYGFNFVGFFTILKYKERKCRGALDRNKVSLIAQ